MVHYRRIIYTKDILIINMYISSTLRSVLLHLPLVPCTLLLMCLSLFLNSFIHSFYFFSFLVFSQPSMRHKLPLGSVAFLGRRGHRTSDCCPKTPSIGNRLDQGSFLAFLPHLLLLLSLQPVPLLHSHSRSRIFYSQSILLLPPHRDTKYVSRNKFS